jgi:hypothetical protein
MHPDELRKRQKFVKSTPLKDRLVAEPLARRDNNFVQMEKVENSEFDTFFDYEDDLSGLMPSNKQLDDVSSAANQSRIVMEKSKPTASSIIIEERVSVPVIMREVKSIADDKELVNAGTTPVEGELKKAYTDVVGFEFVRCEYIMKNKSRCKRQAPKGGTICSIHRKIIEKNKE